MESQIGESAAKVARRVLVLIYYLFKGCFLHVIVVDCCCSGSASRAGNGRWRFTEDYERAGRSLFHILSEIPWERRRVEGKKVHVVILGRLQGASIE